MVQKNNKPKEYVVCQNKRCKKKINLTEIIENGEYEKLAGEIIFECPFCYEEQILK